MTVLAGALKLGGLAIKIPEAQFSCAGSHYYAKYWQGLLSQNCFLTHKIIGGFICFVTISHINQPDY